MAAKQISDLDLREDFALSLAKLPAGQKRVDREKKIIYGVRLQGLTSKNTHGVDDVDGTDYDLGAIRESNSLYEGIQAYADHPPRENPNKERSIRDVIGLHHNIRADDKGRISDFHLIPHHELTECILDAAENEKLAGAYSFSHNARGGGEVRGRRYVVTKITEARSCDLVAKGSTTRNLYESPESKKMKTTLGKIVLESSLPENGVGLTKAVLLEMGDMMNAEVDADGDWKADLVAAIGKLVKSASDSDHSLAKKILCMLKPEKAAAMGEGEKTVATNENKESAEYKESLAVSSKLLTTMGLKAEGPLLEALASSPTLDSKLSIIAAVKETAAAIAPQRPGFKPPPGPAKNPDAGKQLTEGQEVKFDDLYGKILH